MKCRITIATQEKRLTVDLPDHEEAERRFLELVQILLDRTREQQNQAVWEEVAEHLTGDSTEQENPAPEAEPVEEQQEIREPEETNSSPYTYRGMMYIKCPACGEIQGTCYRYYKNHHICKACGEKQLFREPLRFVKAICPQCGKEWKYHTNIRMQMFSMPCLECQASMQLYWSPEEDRYLSE